MKQISIDIETLGTNIDSQILSIGACEFDIKTGFIYGGFYTVIDLETCGKHLNTTADTLEFWLKQGDAPKQAIWDHESKVPLREALKSLSSWLKAKGEYEIWACGTKFDIGMLEYVYTNNGYDIPWKYNAERDMRTLRKFAGDIDVDFDGILHHALDDAIWQAKYISAAANKLNLI